MEFYIEVELKKEFGIISETLSRIGILNKDKKELYQTCHVVQKDDKFYIVHFKELFSYFSFKNDGKIETEKIHINKIDEERRNTIIFLLQTWGFISLADHTKQYVEANKGYQKIVVIPHKDKNDYTFVKKVKI